jgi:hypothetical protein
VLELRQNLTNPLGLFAFALFMLPWAWLASRIARRQNVAEAPQLGLFFGSVIYLVMWFVVGRLEEVRIFLPYAVALIPLTVESAMHYFPTGRQTEGNGVRMVDSHIS